MVELGARHLDGLAADPPQQAGAAETERRAEEDEAPRFRVFLDGRVEGLADLEPAEPLVEGHRAAGQQDAAGVRVDDLVGEDALEFGEVGAGFGGRGHELSGLGDVSAVAGADLGYYQCPA